MALVAQQEPKEAAKELERCVKELGFNGCILNPDPFENSGTEAPALVELPVSVNITVAEIGRAIRDTAREAKESGETVDAGAVTPPRASPCFASASG